MSFSFNTSLSGLNANANALNVIGNNIANANTIGFRGGTITFSDVFADATGIRLNGGGNTRQIGNGVQTSAVFTNFSQGNLNESFSPLHAAINGDGFFAVKQNDGVISYTRAGDFVIDNDGFLVTPSGAQVQGYTAENGGIPQTAVLDSVQIPIGQTLAPQLTSQATLRLNLDAEAEAGATFNTTIKVYDSRGVAHDLDYNFVKQANGTFEMTGTLNNTPFETSVDGNPADANPVVFSFDSNGDLLTPTTLSIVPDQTQLNGATLPAIEQILRQTNPDGSPGAFNVTSYASESAVSSASQDGFPAGELSNAVVDADGYIYGVFTNGQSNILGQYAVAKFNSNDGLQRIGSNMYQETLSSGQATIGVPGTGGRGLIAGGFLEQSNVNITNEFVELIEAQRGFQANSRVISGLNQTFQEILQIL